MVSGPQHEVSVWRRFIFPLLFVLALFIALFMRRPEATVEQHRENKTSVEERVASHPPQMVLHGNTMGTTYNIKLVPPDATAAQQWHTLQAQIDTRLEEINELMSTYRPQSDISKLNASTETNPVKLQTEFAQVVRAAIEVGHRTQGAFDITLGPLIELWGFDKGDPRTAPPTSTEIQERQTYTGLSKISIKDGSFQKTDGRVNINLSGIAKGYGVDAIGALLSKAGVDNFMVEIGGEILVQGHNAKGSPWRLGVNRPTPEAGRYEIIETAQLRSGGMATSGSYRNFFNEEGRRYHHIIHPKTGTPVDHQLVSVTVIAPTCMLADALATAAMVLGQTAFESVLKESYPHVSALFVHQKNERFEVIKTPQFPSTQNVKSP